MQADSVPKVPVFSDDKTRGPECGGEFCQLGCICTSLIGLEKAPLHCRRPECMFGCTCFKRKLLKKANLAETEPQINSIYCKTTVSLPTCPFLNVSSARSFILNGTVTALIRLIHSSSSCSEYGTDSSASARLLCE